ncbi:hypothetical protein VTO73DRAFT_14963 [Trametes versicolor]
MAASGACEHTQQRHDESTYFRTEYAFWIDQNGSREAPAQRNKGIQTASAMRLARAAAGPVSVFTPNE